MNSNCIGKSTFVHYFLEGHHCGDDGDGDGDDCDGDDGGCDGDDDCGDDENDGVTSEYPLPSLHHVEHLVDRSCWRLVVPEGILS